jgi:hypothetical protein
MRFAIICLLLLYMMPAAAQHFLIPLPERGDRIKEFTSTANKAFHIDFLSVRVEERVGPKKQLDKYHITIYKEKCDSAFRLSMMYDTFFFRQLKHIPDSAIVTEWLMPDIAEQFAYRVINRDTVTHDDSISISMRFQDGRGCMRQFSLIQLINKAESRISLEDLRRIGNIFSQLLPPAAHRNFAATGCNAWKTGACPSCFEFYGSINFTKTAGKKEQQDLYNEVTALLKAGKHPNLSYRWSCTSFELERSDSTCIGFKGAITLSKAQENASR